MEIPTLITTMTEDNAPDGQPANLITLQNTQGMTAVVMDIGATWLSCTLPIPGQAPREVLLGVSNMADFISQSTYLGATVGRYANRINKGQFSINKQAYQVDTNQAGNCLHGGSDGFDQRRWQISSQTAHSVTFTLLSEDGDQGFPGTLTASVNYTLTEQNQMQISYHAVTDKATPVNLTNHAYFNLDGADPASDCRKHSLKIDADQYLPTNETGIPLDGLTPVTDTSFDFRQAKLIKQDFLQDQQQQLCKGYDHAFQLNTDGQLGQLAAQLTSADKAVTLNLYTTKPAMQLYTGNWLAGTPNRNAGVYSDYAGIALETQFLPDSPNHPEWSSNAAILAAEKEYYQKTIYEFIYS